MEELGESPRQNPEDQEVSLKDKAKAGYQNVENKCVQEQVKFDNRAQEKCGDDLEKVYAQANDIGEKVNKSVNKAASKLKGWFSRKKKE